MATGELRFRKETKKNIILNMMRYSITETDESSKLNTLAMKMLYYFFYLFNQEDISDDAEEYKVKGSIDEFLELTGSDRNTTRIREAAKKLSSFVCDLKVEGKYAYGAIFTLVEIPVDFSEIEYTLNNHAKRLVYNYKDQMLISPQNACNLSSVSRMRLYDIYKQAQAENGLVFKGNNGITELKKLLLLGNMGWEHFRKFLDDGTEEINKKTEIIASYIVQKSGKSHIIDTIILNAQSKDMVETLPLEIKTAYGRYKNVFLSDEDYEQVKKWFPDSYEYKIGYLSIYLSEGKAKYPTDPMKELYSWWLNQESDKAIEKQKESEKKESPQKKKRGRPKKQPNPNIGKGYNLEFSEKEVQALTDLANRSAAVINGTPVDQYLAAMYAKMCEKDPKTNRHKYLKTMIENDKNGQNQTAPKPGSWQDIPQSPFYPQPQRKGSYFVPSSTPYMDYETYERTAHLPADEEYDENPTE